MNNNELYLDAKCLGSEMQLVDVRPDMYANGVRQEAPQGHIYDLVLPAHKFDKLSVRIPGEKQMEVPSPMQTVTVEFDGLKVRPYVDRSGRLALTATASAIRPVKPNSNAGNGNNGRDKA